MAKTVVLDEWHLTVRIPATLPDAQVRAVRRVLNATAFTTAVRQAILTVTDTKPALKPVRVAVTR